MPNPMDTVPLDGRKIRFHMPDGNSFMAEIVDGLVDANGDSCWCWGAVDEDEAPDDWTDGICWEQNENGKPSTYPVGWSPS